MAQYERRNACITAFFHDGSDDSAKRIGAWLEGAGRRANVFIKGEFDYDLTHAYVRFDNDRYQNLIHPNSWIIRLAEGLFYILTQEEFTKLYKPIEKGSHYS